MKKKLQLMFKIIFICFVILGIFQTIGFADEYETKMGSLIGTLDDGSDAPKLGARVNTVTGTVITVVRIIGVCIAIVMLLVIAMKYMTAAPGERADIKKSAIQYVVGAIVLFAVTGILGLINQFAGVIKPT